MSVACPRCGEPFARESYRALHLARRHEAPYSEEEDRAIREALAEEDAYLKRLRRHGKAVLTTSPLLVLGFVVEVLALVAADNVGFAFLLTPALFALTGMLYAVAFMMAEEDD